MDTSRSTPNRSFPLAVAVLASLAAGCGGSSSSSTGNSPRSTQALFVLAQAPAENDQEVPAHAYAHFLRMLPEADWERAREMVGASLQLPTLGQCVSSDELQRAGFPVASAGALEMVDVGEVQIQAEGQRNTLAPRAFPDVVDLVSGVVYTTREPLSTSFLSATSYEFTVSGSASVPALRVQAVAPPPLRSVTVLDSLLEGVKLTLPRGNLPLAWERAGTGDLIYADLTDPAHPNATWFRCAFSDTGSAVIPASALPQGEDGRLVVHRLHREHFLAPGIDQGEIRFDVARAGNILWSGALPR